MRAVLFRQVASVKPKVICALGTFGAQTLLRTKEPISRLRGQLIDFRGQVDGYVSSRLSLEESERVGSGRTFRRSGITSGRARQ
jgi:hypothetical protein